MSDQPKKSDDEKVVIEIKNDLMKMTPAELADYTRHAISINKKVDQHFIGEEYVMGIIGHVINTKLLDVVLDSVKQICPLLLREIFAEMDQTTLHEFEIIAKRKAIEFFEKKGRQDYFRAASNDIENYDENTTEYSDEQNTEESHAIEDNLDYVTEGNTNSDFVCVEENCNTVMKEDDKCMIVKEDGNKEEAKTTQMTIKEDDKCVIVKEVENKEEINQKTIKEQGKEALKIGQMDKGNTTIPTKRIINAEKVFICPRCNFSTAYRSIMKKHFKNKRACEAQGCIKLNNIVLTEDIKNRILNIVHNS